MRFVWTASIATAVGLASTAVYFYPLSYCFAVFVIALLLWPFVHGKMWLSHLCVFLLFCCFAHINVWHWNRPARALAQIEDFKGKLFVRGKVLAAQHLDDQRGRLDLSVSSAGGRDDCNTLHGTLRLRLYIESYDQPFLPGDKVELETKLRVPRLFGTPGEFDWPLYLHSEKMDVSGWIKSSQQIRLLSSGQGGVVRHIAARREEVAGLIHSNLSPSKSQLVRALVLGEGRVLDKDLRAVLSQAGVSHLFAISGLHLALIALLGYRCLRRIYVNFSPFLLYHPAQMMVPLLLLPLLLGYLIFTGDAIATRRAFALALLAALFLYRRYCVNPLQLLLSLALLSLLCNPLMFWRAGWQLSFAGAAGILLWKPLWSAPFVIGQPRLLRYLLQLFIVSLGASLATLPLVIFNFHIGATVGPAVNLIAVPLITLLILPLGLIGLIVCPFYAHGSVLIFNLCGSALKLMVDLFTWLLNFSAFRAYHLYLDRWQIAALTLVCLAPLLSAYMKPVYVRIGLWSVILITAAALWWLPGCRAPSLCLTMVSVGQGEALLLQNRSGQNVLIDGGGLYSKRFDVGERLLAPTLGALRVRQLDAIILSHDHPDHRKGLLYIIDHFKVRRFYSGHEMRDLHGSLRRALKRNGLVNNIAPAGWSTLSFWHDGSLRLHNNARDDFNENDQSLSLYLQTGGHDGVLLTGDLEGRGVDALLRAGVPGPVSLLKLPHHGSRYSKIDRLIGTLTPDIALVSSGYGNRFRLPAQEIVALIKRNDIELFRTDLQGSIRVCVKEGEWQALCWENRLFR